MASLSKFKLKTVLHPTLKSTSSAPSDLNQGQCVVRKSSQAIIPTGQRHSILVLRRRPTGGGFTALTLEDGASEMVLLEDGQDSEPRQQSLKRSYQAKANQDERQFSWSSVQSSWRSWLSWWVHSKASAGGAIVSEFSDVPVTNPSFSGDGGPSRGASSSFSGGGGTSFGRGVMSSDAGSTSFGRGNRGFGRGGGSGATTEDFAFAPETNAPASWSCFIFFVRWWWWQLVWSWRFVTANDSSNAPATNPPSSGGSAFGRGGTTFNAGPASSSSFGRGGGSSFGRGGSVTANDSSNAPATNLRLLEAVLLVGENDFKCRPCSIVFIRSCRSRSDPLPSVGGSSFGRGGGASSSFGRGGGAPSSVNAESRPDNFGGTEEIVQRISVLRILMEATVEETCMRRTAVSLASS
uniref:Uncharacterized protein n=1 Tax=Ditylenchus dipsaci TaxID=166011 RepID=A0A915DDU6_9BILA